VADLPRTGLEDDQEVIKMPEDFPGHFLVFGSYACGAY